MLSRVWCYGVTPESDILEVLRVKYPISRKQAIYILKKRLHIRKIYFIMTCEEVGGASRE
jgi:hypothetical protein